MSFRCCHGNREAIQVVSQGFKSFQRGRGFRLIFRLFARSLRKGVLRRLQKVLKIQNVISMKTQWRVPWKTSETPRKPKIRLSNPLKCSFKTLRNPLDCHWSFLKASETPLKPREIPLKCPCYPLKWSWRVSDTHKTPVKLCRFCCNHLKFR